MIPRRLAIGVFERRLVNVSFVRNYRVTPFLLNVGSNRGSIFKTKRNSTRNSVEEELEQTQEYKDAINSGSWIKKYGAIARTRTFQKKMIKWYILGYAMFVAYGIRYFQKEYVKDKEKESLVAKFKQNNGELSEWEQLRLKELNREVIRTTDSLKLQEYHKLKDEHDARLAKAATQEERDAIGEFNPKAEDISIDAGPKTFESKILPPKDLTDFYNGIAPKYDSEIGFEETLSFVGKRRKWVMEQIYGDVLEVACGTGRNIKYLDLDNISSITFLDTSEKMMEITNEKFREQYPDFKKVAFVVGKAEQLLNLASGEKNSTSTDLKPKVKYDTIIETFGLCSHEDPVLALQNMSKLLKPGGRIILLEHGRGTYDFINNILDNRAHKHSETWGCRWNLDIGELVDRSGLEIISEKRLHFGTTWCIVAKNPWDPKKKGEIGFVEKYFSKAPKEELVQK
ncbi:hypothetical protein PACTADRAFT_32756 [Pachysolen tannophilus NRRL Y-2460]|uniref:Methyltransferase type 12 domain-containing protein n=1 Tax=Pachysolen tannophilus NRRL Y-2460 TaxID=669874 RepID=A0A1E4TZT4_PACTA|nr:hypothetical protein PACTADRAFT_32756 [Pachysolen tannophilus NRRL Y-2460]